MAEVSRLGRRIRMLRQRAGLTQQELARRSGVARSAIAGIETGDRPSLSLENTVRVADALSVSLDYLVRGGVHEDDRRAALA